MPGNPASALVCFQLLVVPALAAMCARATQHVRRIFHACLVSVSLLSLSFLSSLSLLSLFLPLRSPSRFSLLSLLISRKQRKISGETAAQVVRCFQFFSSSLFSLFQCPRANDMCCHFWCHPPHAARVEGAVSAAAENGPRTTRVSLLFISFEMRF